MGHIHGVTFRLAATLMVAAALTACANSSSAPTPTATVTALAIGGSPSLSSVGQTTQLTLNATTSTGATQNVAGQGTWQSSNTAVVTVSSTGLVSAQGYGAATITASYQGQSSALSMIVTIAGTWVAAVPGGAGVIWVLSQSQGLVSGTFSIAPITPGNGLSSAIVGGTISGSTFTWTMNGTVGADTGRPECVGTTPIISGISQVATSGVTMNATVQSVAGICDSNLVPNVPVGQGITFTKQ